MEEKKEPEDALKEETVVALILDHAERVEDNDEDIAENGEPIPAELLAEPDKSEAPFTLPLISASAEDKLNPVLELDANQQVQFKENYRISAARSLRFLNNIIAITVCVLLHHLITQQQTEPIPFAIAFIIGAVAFREFHVRRKANAATRTKYILTTDSLHASGPDPNSNWKLRISDIVKATLVSGAGNMKSLVISTSYETFVLNGLESPEKLLRMLPSEVQNECSALEKKLQEIADSIHECKDAEEVAQIRDAKLLYQRVQDNLLQEFPDARVLKPNFSKIKDETSFTMIFMIAALAAAFLGYSAYALPIIPIVLVGYLPGLLPLLRTADCLYIFTPDALFELDRKRGMINTITLNRVSLREHLGDNTFESLYVDDQLHVPTRIEKADAAIMNRWIQKYPNSI